MNTSAASKALGLGSLAVTAWLMSESRKGQAPEWERKFSSMEQQNNYDQVRHHFGFYTGNPTMDRWANKLYGLMLRGPWDIFETMQRNRTYVSGFINDVLLANAVPLGVSMVLLYNGFGKVMFEPFKQGYKTLSKLWSGRQLGTKLWNNVTKGTAWTAQKIVNLCQGMNKSNLPVTLAIVGLGGYLITKFQQVCNGTAQDMFNRNFVNGTEDY